MAITSEILNPLIKSFYDGLTREQWELLKSGSPDISTKSMLATLLFDIIQSVSNNLIKSVQNVQVKISKEEVQKSLGESLPNSFAEALGVDVDMDEQSSTLTALVANEVAESLKSAFSTSDYSVSLTSKRMAPSPTLNNMLEHALSMLKVFMAKVKDVMTPKVRMKEPLLSDLAMLKQNLPSADTFVVAISEAVQQILQKEMHDMTQPILKDMMDMDDEQLQATTCAEIKDMSDEIAQLLAEELKEQERSVAEGSRSRNKPALKKTRRSIKRFFTKCFTRAWLIYIVAQLRKKYGFRPLKPSASMQSLVTRVDSLLKFEDGEKQGVGNEESVSTIFRGNDQLFSRELSELVYNHINNCGPKPDTKSSMDSDSWSSSSSTISETPSAIQRTVQHRVQGFLTLVRWWWDTQADSHSKMVCEVLAKVQGRAPFISGKSEDETKKMMVGILVEKVVLRTLGKAKVSCEVANPLIISQGLLEKVWTGVKGVDFDVSQDTLKDFDKTVFNELLEQWGSAELMVALMRLERLDFKNSFALVCRERLIPPTKRNVVCRFFSRSSK